MEYLEGLYDDSIAHIEEIYTGKALDVKLTKLYYKAPLKKAGQVDTEAALCFVERALKAAPSLPDARVIRGCLRIRKNDIYGAIDDISYAVEQAGFKDIIVFRKLGYVHLYVGNLLKAEETFNRINEQFNIDDLPTCYGLGVIAEKKNNLVLAEIYF